MISETASQACIDGLAQTVPFRFVDRVRFLDDCRVVTEIHARAMPHRYVSPEQADTYAILEFAAQSSGLILRGMKTNRGAGRSFIRSLSGERKTHGEIEFPLQLESRLVQERWTLFEFSFQVHAGSELVFTGSVGIMMGR